MFGASQRHPYNIDAIQIIIIDLMLQPMDVRFVNVCLDKCVWCEGAIDADVS